MRFFKRALECILDALYPNKCIGCDTIIPKGDNFCHFCHEALPRTATDKRCKVCGEPRNACLCNFKVFHFTRATAPFYNQGAAKQAMYALKFRRKNYFADFFAEQMAITVRTDYPNIGFGGIAYVPLPLKRELKRGYNQSRELALRLSKLLNIPLIENALGCNNKRKIQHSVKLKERFTNVKGAFYPNVSLNGRRILLVDDIKTTGATLDECSRALLKAGAYEVYCITGLISKGKNKDKKKEVK